MKTALAGIMLCILSVCSQTGILSPAKQVSDNYPNTSYFTKDWKIFNTKNLSNLISVKEPAGIVLNIPRTKLINADAFTFEVTLTNADVFCASENACMISLQVLGEKNNSNVFLSRKVQDKHCADMMVGETFASFLPAGNYDHTKKETISVLYNTNVLKVFRNGTFITKMKYENPDKLGALKQIALSLLNCGKVNQLKLFDARSGKILMKEEFNAFGQKDVHWYF